MADQQVRYIVYIDGAERAQLALRGMETSADRAERSIGSMNDALRNLGVGIGLNSVKNLFNEWVQGAADMETANKRIKFASESLADGETNMRFISDEADKYKIKILEATNAYGKFLAMLSGSGIAEEKVRKLHDELLLIGKVKGLADGQLDAAVMNLGKMLEAGALDARHLRPLEMQLSGIGKFIADELGVTVHELALLRNKGRLTDVDPFVLLRAVEKQAQSLRQFEPEATNTIQSDLNDISNAWLRFKTSLVMDNRGELKEFFGTLRDGVKYLSDHRADIEHGAHMLVNLGKAWLVVKAGSLAGNIYSAFIIGFVGRSAAVVTAAEAQALAFNSLAAAMDRVVYATELMAGASLTGAVGLGRYGIPLATAGAAGMTGAGVGTGAAAAGGGALAGVSVLGGALLVTLTAAAATAVGLALHNAIYGDVGSKTRLLGNAGVYDSERDIPMSRLRKVADSSIYDLRPHELMPDENAEKAPKIDTIYSAFRWVADSTKDISTFSKLSEQTQKALLKNAKKPADLRGGKSGSGDAGHIIPPTDKVTGQRVINYYITVKEVNGIKQNTVQEGGKFDERRVGELLRDEIMSILHDTQLRTGN